MDFMRIMRATGLSGIRSVPWQSATASVIGDGLADLHCPFLSHGLDLRACLSAIFGEATLVGSEKQKGESCIGEGGSELPLQLSTYYQRVRA